MNLYIMRHGETFWNRQGLIQGSSDIELTPFGVELAEKTRDGFAADGIRFQRIYASPYVRAMETARIINEAQGAELIVDGRVREMCFGKYEGMPIREIQESDLNIQYCFSVPSCYVADESGESFAQVYARVDDFLNHEILPLEREPGIENVLVVCHGAVIRAFLTRIRQMDLDEFWTIHQPNCSVNRIALRDGTFTSEQENILYYDARDLLKRGIL